MARTRRADAPANRKAIHRVQVWVTKPTVDKLDRMAKRRGITRSTLGRQLLEDALAVSQRGRSDIRRKQPRERPDDSLEDRARELVAQGMGRSAARKVAEAEQRAR